MADQISALYARGGKGDYRTVHSVIGESGQPIAVISKGAQDTGRTGRAYAATLFEVRAIKQLALAAGVSYGVGAIVMTNGENDATNPGYEDAVRKLWTDYNTDLKAITGQATSIPIFLTQQHSTPFGAGSSALSTLVTWRLGVKYRRYDLRRPQVSVSTCVGRPSPRDTRIRSVGRKIRRGLFSANRPGP